MRKNLLTLVTLMTLFSFNGYSQCKEETFFDNFEGTSLDPNKWDYDLGNNNGWGNNELEYYTNGSNNITLKDGKLIITPKYQANYNGSGKNYTSARIVTRGKYSQTYGRFEAKIKVPNAPGVWPAFWMLGDNISTKGWPMCGEIDIMETTNDASKLWNTVHYGQQTGTNPDGSPIANHLSIGTSYLTTLSDDFHVYAFEWDTQQLRWYLDGVLKFTVNRSQITSNGASAFDNPFHMLLNVAVGGNFASGTPTQAAYTYNGDPLLNPAAMIVEYVQVTQPSPCYTSLTSPANNASFVKGTDISVSATNPSFNPDTTSKVEFYNNDTKVGEALNSPYGATFTTTNYGSQSITAKATNSLGRKFLSNPVSIVVPQAPYGGTAITIGGPSVKIEAENYDEGVNGLSYKDLSYANSGGVYRTDNVDLVASTDAGGTFDVVNTANGEWLEYTINVQKAGPYTLEVRYIAPKTSKLTFDIDGQTATLASPKGNVTGYTTASLNFPSLSAGLKVLKITFDNAGYSLNYVNFKYTGKARIASLLPGNDNAYALNALEVYPNPTENSSIVKLNVADASNAEYSVVNSMGVEVSRGKLSSNLEGSINLAGMEKGIYFVKVVANDKVYVEKLVKE